MADNDDKLERLATHMAKLNDEMGDVQVDVSAIKVDLVWLKRMTLWQLGLLGSLLLGSVGYILFV